MLHDNKINISIAFLSIVIALVSLRYSIQSGNTSYSIEKTIEENTRTISDLLKNREKAKLAVNTMDKVDKKGKMFTSDFEKSKQDIESFSFKQEASKSLQSDKIDKKHMFKKHSKSRDVNFSTTKKHEELKAFIFEGKGF